MPGNDRFWLDDGERRVPARPEARQTDPQQAVSRGQFQAFCSSSPKNTDLETQSQVLELEGGTRSEDRRQSREECHKSSEHRRNYERCNTRSWVLRSPTGLRPFDDFFHLADFLLDFPG